MRASAQFARGVKWTRRSQGSPRPFGGFRGRRAGPRDVARRKRSPVATELLELQVPGFCL